MQRNIKMQSIKRSLPALVVLALTIVTGLGLSSPAHASQDEITCRTGSKQHGAIANPNDFFNKKVSSRIAYGLICVSAKDHSHFRIKHASDTTYSAADYTGPRMLGWIRCPKGTTYASQDRVGNRLDFGSDWLVDGKAPVPNRGCAERNQHPVWQTSGVKWGAAGTTVTINGANCHGQGSRARIRAAGATALCNKTLAPIFSGNEVNPKFRHNKAVFHYPPES